MFFFPFSFSFEPAGLYMIIFLVVLEEVEETEGKKNGRNNGVVFEMSGVGKGRRWRRAIIVKWKVREN